MRKNFGLCSKNYKTDNTYINLETGTIKTSAKYLPPPLLQIKIRTRSNIRTDNNELVVKPFRVCKEIMDNKEVLDRSAVYIISTFLKIRLFQKAEFVVEDRSDQIKIEI